jgi:formate dehydrogenase iron-sulfur subunit
MKAILTDTTKCVGCEKCVQACKRVNGLGDDIPFRWRLEDGLNSTRWTTIVRRAGGVFVRKQCRHCLEPACASACPVGALQHTADGPVIYDVGKCLGCRYCMMACPFGIPRYEWESPVPHVEKCTMCFARQARGEQPGCTEACPTKATIFGTRDELLAEAHRRIAADPDRYVGTVFGETDVGGTCVLYVSGIDLGFLHVGRAPGDEPMPERTRLAMHAVPFAFVGMGVLMGSLAWIIGRRNERAEAAHAGETAHDDKPGGDAAGGSGADGGDASEGTEGPAK